ncbi:hypothetical protein SAMN05877753_1029 [Bacillus oleivorans]|uniref:Uncharacterized protein n=1 Tax=Bacillus oleivorans TaxID=1448271 RepID=A0A285CKC3_9BACI|nr:hypothetical protein [Bacillus oleivorans]SNX67805.1 hypothetical protein SAMN05877753_1029 [Bacillus oleivorans]
MLKKPRLTLDLQYFAEGEESWESFLAQPSVDDQPEVESEEVTETEVAEDVVEPDSDETTETETEETIEEETEETEDTTLDDDTEIELGEDKKPVKLSELKNGYLRQSDYTKKTQALADERKAFETEKETYKPVKEWLDYINGNPYLFDQINKAIDQWEKTGALPIEEVLENAESAKYFNHLLAENKRLQSELDQIQGEYQSTKFETDMKNLVSDLKAEYGDLLTPEYEESLKAQAKQESLSIDVLKRIAKGDLAEQKLKQEKEASKKTEAKTKQKIRETKLPPQPKNKGNSPAPKEIDLDGDWLSVFKQVGS